MATLFAEILSRITVGELRDARSFSRKDQWLPVVLWGGPTPRSGALVFGTARNKTECNKSSTQPRNLTDYHRQPDIWRVGRPDIQMARQLTKTGNSRT